MLNWLFRYKKTEEVPHYSALKATPTRGLPPEVGEDEESQSFKARRDTLEQALLDPVRRPPIEAPLFTELLAKKGGVVTLTLPNDGRIVFLSSAHRFARPTIFVPSLTMALARITFLQALYSSSICSAILRKSV